MDEQERTFAANYRRIGGLLKPSSVLIGATIVIDGISAVVGLIPPIETARLLDVAIPARSMVLAAEFVLIMAGANIASVCISFGINYFETIIEQRIITQLRLQVYESLQSGSPDSGDDHSPGEITNKIYSDVEILGRGARSLVALASPTLLLIATIFVMMRADWRLTAASLVAVPVVFLALRVISSNLECAQVYYQSSIDRFLTFTHDRLSRSGRILIRRFGISDAEASRSGDLSLDIVSQHLRWVRLSQLYSAAFTSNSLMTPIIVWLFGSWLVFQGKLTVGLLVAFGFYLRQAYAALLSVGDLGTAIIATRTSFQRLEPHLLGTLDSRSEINRAGCEATGVLFEGVSFVYGIERDVLSHVTFLASSSEYTAIVGRSGSGKSTILKLIAGELRPSAGRVGFCGVDQSSAPGFGPKIAIVDREPYFFEESLLYNLRCANSAASESRIYEVVRAMGLEDAVLQLPFGYNSKIGQSSSLLSSGERQRIACSQAILQEPQLLLLDESTSALDAETERLVFAAFRRFLPRATIIFAAHRASTVQVADKILVLDAGRIVGAGSHFQLLGTCVDYARFVAQNDNGSPAVVH